MFSETGLGLKDIFKFVRVFFFCFFLGGGGGGGLGDAGMNWLKGTRRVLYASFSCASVYTDVLQLGQHV